MSWMSWFQELDELIFLDGMYLSWVEPAPHPFHPKWIKQISFSSIWYGRIFLTVQVPLPASIDFFFKLFFFAMIHEYHLISGFNSFLNEKTVC